MPKSHLTLRTALFVLFATLTLTFLACGGGSSETPGTEPEVNVVTTIYPLTYFTERVGGERARVTPLIRPGIEAHDFEPTSGDIRTIAAADVLIYNHPAFEAWVADAVDAASSDGLVVVETADVPD
jgi:ABC-type Zn uptake system ZnuABC Zn-binding protein ZnuA